MVASFLFRSFDEVWFLLGSEIIDKVNRYHFKNGLRWKASPLACPAMPFFSIRILRVSKRRYRRLLRLRCWLLVIGHLMAWNQSGAVSYSQSLSRELLRSSLLVCLLFHPSRPVSQGERKILIGLFLARAGSSFFFLGCLWIAVSVGAVWISADSVRRGDWTEFIFLPLDVVAICLRRHRRDESASAVAAGVADNSLSRQTKPQQKTTRKREKA